MKKAFVPLFVLAPLLIALCLRLYPTIITGMPFSTDGWPIIRNTQLLLSHTPVPLNSKMFDGYNNYMPANSIFSAILSEVIGVVPIKTMALGIPIVGALAVPIFYVLVNRVTKNSKISLIASILLATAFPYTMFTAGVTKETFASPIYMALILLFLLKHNWKTTLLFSTVSIALALSHQLTTFLTIVVLGILAVGLYVNKGNKEQNLNSNKSNIIYIAIVSTIAGLYFGLYATPAITVSLNPNEIITLGAYIVLITSVIIYLVYKPRRPKPSITFLECSVSFLAPAVLLYLETRIPLLPGAPTLPLHYFLYAMPFLVSGPLIVYGLNGLHKNNFSLIVPVFWLTAILCLAFFTVFANIAGGAGFVYRFLNFMLPPMIILTAVALNKIYVAKPWRFKLSNAKFASGLLIVLMAVTGAFTLYAAVSLQEPYLGYFWTYKPQDYAASNWVAVNGANQTITADVKTQFLLNDYFQIKVSVLPGLNYLQGTGSAPSILYIYNQMKTDGYVLYGGSPISLPENWVDKLAGYNVVYVNSEVTMYAEG
jgi:hypothetical protein